MVFVTGRKGEAMRLIDAEELERDGWYLCRTVQVDKNTMEYQTKKPTAFKVLEVVRCKDCKLSEALPSAQPTQTNTDSTHENTLDCVSRQQVIDGIKKEILKGDRRFYKGLLVANHVILHLPSVQPELIEQGAYVRGFEQGRTQGMIDAKEGKK